MMHDYAWVWWDCDAGEWVIECWACGQLPTAPTPGLPDTVIHATLLAAAERHNQQRHTNCSIKEEA